MVIYLCHIFTTYYKKESKVNLTLRQYEKIFDRFSKKIRKGETYQIKICQKYQNKSTIDPIKFFWDLMKVNCSPEAFVIRDKKIILISPLFLFKLTTSCDFNFVSLTKLEAI